VDFDSDACTQYARRLKPSIEVIRTSAKTGNGIRRWHNWLSCFREGSGAISDRSMFFRQNDFSGDPNPLGEKS
jgi:hypothetical protein